MGDSIAVSLLLRSQIDDANNNSSVKVREPERNNITDLPPLSQKDGIGPDKIRKLAEKEYKDTDDKDVKERGFYPITSSNARNWHSYAVVRIPCSGATLLYTDFSPVGEVRQEKMPSGHL